MIIEWWGLLIIAGGSVIVGFWLGAIYMGGRRNRELRSAFGQMEEDDRSTKGKP
jgi:hypothetical protein